MLYRENGYRFFKYDEWGEKNIGPYNYEKNGLLRHMLSKSIISSKNPILKIILKYYEQSIIFLLKYTDILKNFKNHHWKNR